MLRLHCMEPYNLWKSIFLFIYLWLSLIRHYSVRVKSDFINVASGGSGMTRRFQAPNHSHLQFASINIAAEHKFIRFMQSKHWLISYNALFMPIFLAFIVPLSLFSLFCFVVLSLLLPLSLSASQRLHLSLSLSASLPFFSPYVFFALCCSFSASHVLLIRSG